MMDARDDALEWQVIAEALAERASTAPGREQLAGLGPLASRAEVEQSLATVDELRRLLQDGARLGLAGVEDLRGLLGHAEKEGVLEPLELLTVGRTLQALAELRQQTRDLERCAPQVHALCADLGDHAPLGRALLATFDAQGQIVDDASADLGERRHRAARLRDEIKEQMGVLVDGLDRQGTLQERFVTLRSDRYVVPVRADRRGEVAGIVHDTSHSGQTLFIEPQAVVDLGNRLKIAEAAVLDEEQRILRGLTARLCSHAPQLRADLTRVAILDGYVARARLAADLEAEAPVLVDAPVLELRQARHPALALAARARRDRGEVVAPVVANDLVLGEDQPALVLSGPNAGGKTVALKTAGLCARMLRAGLPIPALGSSRCALFDDVHAVIGDAQSIAAAQSTFSAHMLALDGMLQAVRAAPAGHRTLCLIDEIAHATDPLQGASLGQAVLEALVERGALVVATTHYEALKALALSDPRFRNASVALDQDSLRPTYRIHLDLPGASSAFAIVLSLGVAPDVVERARALAGEQARRLEVTIEALADEKGRLQRARTALEEVRVGLTRERETLQGALREARERERLLKRQAREDLLADVRRTRRQVAEIVATLQGRPAPRAVDQAAHQLKEIEARLEHRLDAGAADDDAGPPLVEVRAGARVYLPALRQDGQVLGVQGEQVEVQVGGLRTRVVLAELRAPRQASATGSARRQQQRRQAALARDREPDDDEARPVAARTPRTARNTLDLRGQRVVDALEAAERFFDAMLRDEVHRVFLLHGHGTGALREALRRELPASSYVRRVQPAAEDDGGDAFTVVDLA